MSKHQGKTVAASGTPSNSKDASERERGVQYARQMVDKEWKDSSLVDLSYKLPAFGRDEVQMGRVLGQGAFGIVHEVKSISIDPTLQKDDRNHGEARSFLSTHCCRQDKSKDARYAVKMLTQDVISDPAIFTQAIMDMAIETRILSNLDDHPNICKLRAVSASRDPYTEDYMLILDRLYDTLSSRIEIWRRVYNRCKSKATKWLVDRGGKKMQALRENQLTAAMDLCAALDHLHQRRIVFRDLKPENVGFDIRDDIKLFDFGLAKELRRENKVKDDSGNYHLTGMTGSPRYMAPEVGNEQPYNESCDSHSFAVLFWEMYSLKTPYELYTVRTLREKAWNEPHKRPFLQPKWPASIRNLMEQSWNPDPTKRWSTARILKALNEECSKIADGVEGGRSSSLVPESQSENLEYVVGGDANGDNMDQIRSAKMRRKSTFVFRGSNMHRPHLPMKAEPSGVHINSTVHNRVSMLEDTKTSAAIVEFDDDDDDDDADDTHRASWGDDADNSNSVLNTFSPTPNAIAAQ